MAGQPQSKIKRLGEIRTATAKLIEAIETTIPARYLGDDCEESALSNTWCRPWLELNNAEQSLIELIAMLETKVEKKQALRGDPALREGPIVAQTN